MTDRHDGYIVVLETNVRDDDADATMKALRQIKNVADVIPHIADVTGAIANSKAKIEITNRLYAVLRDIVLGK